MKEILLVIPPAPYLTSDRVFPPLGILYVAAYLIKNKRKVKICDLTGEKFWQKKFISILKKTSCDFLGITATTADMPIAFKILKLTKKVKPKVKVILGGAHPTISPETCMDFDRIVIGEGLKGSLIVFNEKSPKIIKTKLSNNLNDLPLPNRDLIDNNKYSYLLNNKRAVNIISHLGCPFQCVFCSGRTIDYYKKVRFRKVEDVIKEMDFLNKKYGYEAFVFYDDEFNLNKEYVLKFCKLVKNKNYIWRVAIRADLLDEEMAFAMAKSGCVEVTVGVESGSDKVLKLCNKNTSSEINSKAREICKKAKIRFKAFVVVGLPFSTLKDEKLTLKWLIDNKPDAIDININTPYPSTIEYEEKEKYKLKFKFNFLKESISYKYDPKKYKSFCSNSFLTKEEILKIRNYIDKKVRKILKI